MLLLRESNEKRNSKLTIKTIENCSDVQRINDSTVQSYNNNNNKIR